jgi:hypothetical protein
MALGQAQRACRNLQRPLQYFLCHGFLAARFGRFLVRTLCLHLQARGRSACEVQAGVCCSLDLHGDNELVSGPVLRLR